MQEQASAWDYLQHGDAINDRVRRDRTGVSVVARDAGLNEAGAAKAAWLARRYGDKTRAQLGPSILGRLTPTHLEVVATCPTPVRDGLLRRAASEGLAARALKRLAHEHRETPSPSTTLETLTTSIRAMEVYAGFDKPSLQKLLDGPNGRVVRQVALAGRVLATRITELPS